MKQKKVWIQTSFLEILEASVSLESCPHKLEKSSKTHPQSLHSTAKTASNESELSNEQSKKSAISGHSTSRTVVVAVNELNRTIGEDHIRAKYTNEEVDAVLRLRDEGYSLANIARMTEIPIRTIRGYIDGSRRCQQPAAWRVKRV